MKTPPQASPAFTLVELLVTISVIAVISAIAFPLMKASRESAPTANCASNLRQIGAACLSFASEHDGNFPASDAGGTWPFSTYMVQINPYLANGATSTFEQQKEVCFG